MAGFAVIKDQGIKMIPKPFGKERMPIANRYGR
jgi:hypothetical protein